MWQKSVTLGLAGLAGLACAAGVAAKENPNVVIILADDLGWADVGYHGSDIKTPNIDRIAAMGIELDRYYVAPISSPTRAGLLTGRYPSRYGFREAVIPPWRDAGLPEGEQTIADVLGENGYPNRAIIGKWHLGHSRKEFYPLNRGFNYFYGHLNGAIDYFTHLREGELDWHENWDSNYDKGYSTDLIADKAVERIGQYSQEGPFFIYVAFNAPHTPFQAPEDEIGEHIPLSEFNAMEKGRDKNRIIYKAMVTRMDKGIGKIWDALENAGQLDNTIILFSSDNGGDLAASSNYPLRGTKFTEWDGGVRVPAAIYWKNGFRNGRKLGGQVTGFVDILPTLADIIGIKTSPEREYDGMSMYSVLKGDQQHIDRFMYLGCSAAVGSGFKLILPREKGKMPKKEFLVDYSLDPYEAKNNIAAHDDIVRRMKGFITKYDTITPAFPEDDYGKGSKGFIAPKEWRVNNL